MSAAGPKTLGLAQPTAAEMSGKGSVSTLGMFIIDEFETTDPDGQTRRIEGQETIGGGGVYAMIGARLFLPPTHVGLIIDKGPDLPLAFERQLRAALGEGVWWRDRPEGTTRALNIYSGGRIGEGHQTFRYLFPTKQIHLADLISLASPFPARVSGKAELVHVVARIPRARAILQERDRSAREGGGWWPKLIWEPLDVAGDERLSLDDWCALASHFEIISPNLLELEAILGDQAGPRVPSPGSHEGIQDEQKVPARSATGSAAMDMAHTLWDRLQYTTRQRSGTVPSLVVRAGKHGAYSVTNGSSAGAASSRSGWTPAYWRESDQDKIVDPTGGGNGFLGGLAAGMILSGDDLRIATIFGSAAASYMIQQRGLPTCTSGRDSILAGGEEGKEGGAEEWNGDDPWRRFRDVAARTAEWSLDRISVA